MGNELILSEQVSEYDSLIAQIKILKLSIAALSVEKDDLEFNVCRKLSADYDQKIGHFELEITRYNLEIERLRSIIESMQAAVNRGEAVSRQQAEDVADEKLKGFYQDLEKQTERVKADEEFARQRRAQDRANCGEDSFDSEEVDWEKFFEDIEKLSEFFDSFFKAFDNDDEQYSENSEDDDGKSAKKNINPDKELRMLYLKIVKALHPDNKPNRTERDDILLQEAKEAFETGNLTRLREICEEVSDDDIESRFKNDSKGIEDLKMLLQQLLRQKEALVKEIEHIKSSFPYNIKDFLDDENAVAARQEELKVIIESCKNTIGALNQRIELLQEEMEMKF